MRNSVVERHNTPERSFLRLRPFIVASARLLLLYPFNHILMLDLKYSSLYRLPQVLFKPPSRLSFWKVYFRVFLTFVLQSAFSET